MKVNDWSSIQTVFDKIHKQLEKTMKAAHLSSPPKQYIHILCDLQDFLNETLANRDVKKKARALALQNACGMCSTSCACAPFVAVPS